VQGSQLHEPSRHARQLPSGVILSRGTGDLGSIPPCNNAAYHHHHVSFLHLQVVGHEPLHRKDDEGCPVSRYLQWPLFRGSVVTALGGSVTCFADSTMRSRWPPITPTVPTAAVSCECRSPREP
jgi:hypothetical protein